VLVLPCIFSPPVVYGCSERQWLKINQLILQGGEPGCLKKLFWR